MPTFLSLFSGIGGLDLAMEAMGFECIGQVEWDAACTEVLERHWSDVPRWLDIATYPDGGGRQVEREPQPAGVGSALGDESDRRDAGGSVAADSARLGAGVDTGREPGSGASPLSGRTASAVGLAAGGRVDLVCGGFPCQPVSTAGRRKAQDDNRWLWPQYARVVREVQPRWVFIENVRGLLSAGEPSGDALREVVWDLAQLGYVSRWHCVRASDVGAPHRRERVFLLAERADADGERRALVEERSLQVGDRGEPQPEPGGVDAAASDAHGARREGTGQGQQSQASGWANLDAGMEQLPTVVDDLLPTPIADHSRGLAQTGTDFQSLPNVVLGMAEETLLPTPRTPSGRGQKVTPRKRTNGAGPNLEDSLGALTQRPSEDGSE